MRLWTKALLAITILHLVNRGIPAAFPEPIWVQTAENKSLPVVGIVLFPFIVHSGRITPDLWCHEMAHFHQVRNHGFVVFYVTYLAYFLRAAVRGYSWPEAYKQIPYEQDAAKHEQCLS